MPNKSTLTLNDYSMSDLDAELERTSSEYQKMRFDHATRGLENPLRLKIVRRDIAKIKTEIRRRELEQVQGNEQE